MADARQEGASSIAEERPWGSAFRSVRAIRARAACPTPAAVGFRNARHEPQVGEQRAVGGAAGRLGALPIDRGPVEDRPRQVIHRAPLVGHALIPGPYLSKRRERGHRTRGGAAPGAPRWYHPLFEVSGFYAPGV